MSFLEVAAISAGKPRTLLFEPLEAAELQALSAAVTSYFCDAVIDGIGDAP